MDYKSKIEVTDTGMVVASVFAPDGRRVGLEFFSPIWHSTKNTERSANKARRWAKSHAEMCARVETANEKLTQDARP